jgi:hypothetical protein
MSLATPLICPVSSWVTTLQLTEFPPPPPPQQQQEQQQQQHNYDNYYPTGPEKQPNQLDGLHKENVVNQLTVISFRQTGRR